MRVIYKMCHFCWISSATFTSWWQARVSCWSNSRRVLFDRIEGGAQCLLSCQCVFVCQCYQQYLIVACDFYYEQKNDVQICITQLGISAKFCIQWPLQGSHSDFPIYLTELSLGIFVWLIGLWSCCILDFISMIYWLIYLTESLEDVRRTTDRKAVIVVFEYMKSSQKSINIHFPRTYKTWQWRIISSIYE